MDSLLSLLISIAANLLTPMAKRMIRWPPELDELPSQAVLATDEDAATYDDAHRELIRAYNRARLEKLGRVLWAHFITAFFLFAAFFLPLLVKSLGSQGIDLSSTRLGPWGSDWHVPGGRIFPLALSLTLLLYLPVWLLSQPVAYRAASLWDQLVKVTPARYTALIALSFACLCFVIAGHWIYFLYPTTGYLQALAMPVIAVFGIGYLGSQRR
ncbi:hypothetical protein IQ288_04825 [Burkholderia sp. R-69980]|nr:hypothetical protein [Burkholderia sp. R-69980]